MRKRIIALFTAVASLAQAQKPTEVKDPTKVHHCSNNMTSALRSRRCKTPIRCRPPRRSRALLCHQSRRRSRLCCLFR